MAARKSLKEAVILTGALYAWCTVGGKVYGYCIGTLISFANPHPIPSVTSYSGQDKSSLENLRKSHDNQDDDCGNE